MGAFVLLMVDVTSINLTGVSGTLDQYVASKSGVQTRFAAPGVNGNGRHVTLVLSRPADVTYPALTDDLATNIQGQFDKPVSVTVT